MKSLILTSLYLLKDTLHRWKERPASPISRLLVAFFLSLCALSFLANYVLSTKILYKKIQLHGADLVIVSDLSDDHQKSLMNVLHHDLPQQYGCDVFSLSATPIPGAMVNGTYIPIMEYNITSYSALTEFPLAIHPVICLIDKDQHNILPGPNVMNLGDEQTPYLFPVFADYLPENHFLRKRYRSVILVPQHALDAGQPRKQEQTTYIIQVHQMTAKHVSEIESTIRAIVKLDERPFTNVSSNVPLLKDLDLIMSNQAECRTGFSIGIAVIVGILLTALASMEFRQNEYVYTLMKSFGVRPIMLVGNFIIENIFLIGIAYVSAVIFFMKSQKIVLGEFFKLKDETLTFNDIQADLTLLALSLFLCVLASSLPIIASAYRQIGKVLK